MNGKNFPVANAGSWKLPGKVTTKMTSGDVIKLEGENVGDYNQNNPGAILGIVNYIDKKGKSRTIVTNKGWKCDGEQAREFGNNGGNNIWTSVNGGKPIPDIPVNAIWIWNADPARKTSTCTIRLP